jgi:dTDP-D-glucose 4,6-dehydratase
MPVPLAIAIDLQYVRANASARHISPFPSIPIVSTTMNNCNFQHISCDITNSATVEKFIASQKFDSCIHFAAESHVDNSIASPGDFITSNINGTFSMLEAARATNVQRFHHVSRWCDRCFWYQTIFHI